MEVTEKNGDTHERGVAQGEKDGSGRTEGGLASWSVEVTKQISMRMFICQVICTMAFERSGLSWPAEGKKVVPAPNFGTGTAFGVIGGETPLLLKLDAQTDFEGPRAEGSVRSAERAVL